MTEHDFDDFTGLLSAVLSDVYGKPSPSAFAFKLWWDMFNGYSLQEFELAMRAHVEDAESGQFVPKPADIKRHLEGTLQDQSMVAWGKVREGIKRHGGYFSVCFDDPIIHTCLRDMGGWSNLCLSGTEDELKFKAADFTKRYRAYAKHGVNLDFDPVLHGVFDTENIAAGYGPQAKPKLIGNPLIARAIRDGKTVLELQNLKQSARLRLANGKANKAIGRSA